MTGASATRQRLGQILILAGVTVWLVWGIVWLAGGDPDVRSYLPFHLMGVIPGALLARWDSISRLWARN